MDVNTVDLNLLLVFHAMIQHRGVTRAGQAIGLSQPAMSAAVSRLRTLFDDPLFIKSGAEMKPTPRALELADPVRQVIETIRNNILQRSTFDPNKSDRKFVIVMPDIGESLFLPKLLGRITELAPLARIRTLAMPQKAADEALESGAADLALGYFPDLHKAGYFQQKLFDHPHVCVMREGHPLINRMTLKNYLSAAHVVVIPNGREHVFEQLMRKLKIKRNVVIEVSHYMSLLPLLESSDLVATLPNALAHLYQRYASLRVVNSPIEAPIIDIHQIWHRRYHKDPANVWLRGVVYDLFGGKKQSKVHAVQS